MFSAKLWPEDGHTELCLSYTGLFNCTLPIYLCTAICIVLYAFGWNLISQSQLLSFEGHF
jgi:hypothetical protein